MGHVIERNTDTCGFHGVGASAVQHGLYLSAVDPTTRWMDRVEGLLYTKEEHEKRVAKCSY